jgi:hypothetical protein
VTRPPSPRGGQWPTPGKGRGQFPSTDRGGWPAAREDDGWGPSTAVYSSAAAPAPNRRGFYPGQPKTAPPAKDGAEWAPAGPRPGREQRAVKAAERRTERSVAALENRDAAPERGLTWWAALLVLLGIAALGAIIDAAGSIEGKSGFNVGIVIASVIAVIAVKRSHMFPVVIAPPIVYSAGALFQYYIRRSTASSGLNKRQVFLDAAANYFVYGFPAIAIATAAVLIIAGVRLISRK